MQHIAAIINPETRRIATIMALRNKRSQVVFNWHEGIESGMVAPMYYQATDRMMRLTSAIDEALQNLEGIR